MNNFLNNNIAQGVIITLVAAFVLWVIGRVRFKFDENKILKFLRNSKNETEFTFRGEPAISSETNLSEDRVHKVCSKSNNIKRNQKEKKSWRLKN